MQTPYGHLTYCSNIHTGEGWQEHFSELKKNIPDIKKVVCQNLKTWKYSKNGSLKMTAMFSR
jgi:hypothetical protein